MDWGGAPLKFCPGGEKQMKSENSKQWILTLALAALAISPALGQVASHEPTALKPMVASSATPAASATPSVSLTPVQPVTNRPVVRINGTELTDRDLLREMLIIFPYARQHNGFPKAEEPKIRMGALKMIEFEELVYQEAERRGMTVPSATLQKAQAEFRTQFPNQEAFDEFLKAEMQGSMQTLRKQIRRSLLVDLFLKEEVTDKSTVTLAETRAYYDKNPSVFRYSENFSIQTISILPSEKAGDEVKKQARKAAEEACQKAKATKSYQEFGLLAEKVSEDDFHVNMGDHKTVDRDKLPPEIVKAARAMQPGQVSDLLQLGNFYTCFRLNTHAPAGMRTFAQVKDALRQSLRREKYERLRAGLDQKLRQNAKVEEL
jgi:parvulin-like peptidyl-prolyl isomerase